MGVVFFFHISLDAEFMPAKTTYSFTDQEGQSQVGHLNSKSFFFPRLIKWTDTNGRLCEDIPELCQELAWADEDQCHMRQATNFKKNKKIFIK